MTADPELLATYTAKRLTDRQTDELIGIYRGILADGAINTLEVEFLQKWLVANQHFGDNEMLATLRRKVEKALADGVVDAEEAADLYETMMRFTANDAELGEPLKSTALPLDDPAPDITFVGKLFCLTGTFAHGSRRACEDAVQKLAGEVGSITAKTDYLVIGSYATDTWAHSSYGRKIEKAVELKQKGKKVAIIHEQHWLKHIAAINPEIAAMLAAV